jgi:adenylate kinase family enzyme
VIILEGPDGAGKTTLAASLSAIHKIETRRRIHQDPYLWALAEMTGWERDALCVYDRFPLVGEYIYGPIRRRNISTEFALDNLATTLLLNRLMQDTLIIYCRPPIQVILDNVATTGQPEDIQAKIMPIIQAYDEYFTSVPHLLYDYTDEKPSNLGPTIRAHRRSWGEKGDNS